MLPLLMMHTAKMSKTSPLSPAFTRFSPLFQLSFPAFPHPERDATAMSLAAKLN